MLDKLGGVENRYSELMELMASPEVASKPELLRKYGQEQANLEPIVEAARRYREVLTQLEEARSMLEEKLDSEMRAMVHDEIKGLEAEQETLEQKLRVMLLPKDPNDEK